MARSYTDEDRALVHTVLHANNGNVKRTARETNLPIATVRDWKNKWEREGLPAPVAEVLPAVQDAFVAKATRVRDKMITRLEEAVDQNKVGPKDLLVGVGVLTDKVRLIEGKPTSRTENTGLGALPVEEVRELFAGFAKGIVEAASQRAAIISSTTEEDPIDAEWAPVPEEQATALLTA